MAKVIILSSGKGKLLGIATSEKQRKEMAGAYFRTPNHESSVNFTYCETNTLERPVYGQHGYISF